MTKSELLALTVDELGSLSAVKVDGASSNTYCTGCAHCKYCTGCTGCTRCTGCAYCTDCTDCKGCTYCTDCKGCKGCTDCTDCTDCTGIIGGRSLQFVAYGAQLTREEYDALVAKRKGEASDV